MKTVLKTLLLASGATVAFALAAGSARAQEAHVRETTAENEHQADQEHVSERVHGEDEAHDADAERASHEEHGLGVDPIKAMGAVTFTLLVATACAGLFVRRNPKALLRWHKRLALVTAVSAASHVTLVLLFH